MIGLGTLLNVAAIAAGGLLGRVFGRFVKPHMQETLTRATGVCTMFLGIAGAMEGMLRIEDGALDSGGTMLVIGCIALGALLGELLNIEDAFERFGRWLKLRTGNAKDAQFVDAFVTASLTVCIGAMAVVGAIQDGLEGDYSILAAKAVLDFIIIMVMTCSLGKGCLFSAIPVGAVQGGMTLLARLLRPVITEAALANLSLIGSILIFCVGLNLVFGKKLRVANMLPAIVLAVLAALVGVTV